MANSTLPPKHSDIMGVSTQAVCSNLDVFLTMCKAEHFMLYLPYHGQLMLEFLDSCFHRDFMRHVAAWGFREVAAFTETASLGRIFLLLSRSLDECPFGLENSTALQESGVFSRAFSIEPTGLLPCYAVESNTLLIRQNAFYQPDKMAGRGGGEADQTGTQTLLMYAALRAGLYDVKEHIYLAQPRSHDCESAKRPCTDLPELCITPDLEDVFPPPWNQPYTGVYKMLPYMVLNILTSELGTITSKTHSWSHDTAHSFGLGTTPPQITITKQPTTPFPFLRTTPSPTPTHAITPSTSSHRSTPKPPNSAPPPTSGPASLQVDFDRLKSAIATSRPDGWESLQAAIDRLKSVIAASRDVVRHSLQDGSESSESANTPEPIRAARSGSSSTGKGAGAAAVGSFPTHESALDTDLLRELMGREYGQAEEDLGLGWDDVRAGEPGSDSSSGNEGIEIARRVKTAAGQATTTTRDGVDGSKEGESGAETSSEKGSDETARLDSLVSENAIGETVAGNEVSNEGADVGGAKARRRRRDNEKRKEKKRRRAAGD
ncbi:hypothetical protein GE09DRAFT_1051222 [Coniochaeta sp. 2T2.1]|nr:hypothetical protein GE09DRAFT_1051222 [Coniochaeta sp. 2T2.1]